MKQLQDDQGRPVIRFQVVVGDDGWVRGGMFDVPEPIVLVQIPQPPYDESPEVQAAFVTLVKELASHALRAAFGPDSIKACNIKPSADPASH